LQYVDDILSFSKDPIAVIRELNDDYVLKGVGKPRFYLGGDVLDLDSAWKSDNVETALSSPTYADNIVQKFEGVMEKQFAKKKTPMQDDYDPEADDMPILNAKQSSLFCGFVETASTIDKPIAKETGP
jgi:hypothetical protein